MKQVAGGKHMENDYFPRTLKFEMMGKECNQYIDGYWRSYV
jgi:hypothetical protein